MERLKSPFLAVGVVVWAASLALYLSTLAPTLTWGYQGIGVDGGELLAAANTFGIPHPSGYPTYTLLLKTFATLIPVGDFAHRGNLLSAVLASGSVVAIYWTILHFCRFLRPDGPRPVWIAGSALGAAVFGTAPLVWSQATITEVYALNAFFVAVLLLMASHIALDVSADAGAQLDGARPRLMLFAFLAGLGLGNHLTLLAIAVPLLFWLWTSLGWRRLASPWVIASFVLGLAIYVYLPLRAAQNPPINWGDADTLGGIAWMLSGRVYQDYVFGVPLGSIPNRVVQWAELVFSQLNPLGIFLGVMAVLPLWRMARVFLLMSLASIVVLTTYSVTYNTIDSEVLTIPSFVLLSLSIGVGFVWIIPGISSWVEEAIRRRYSLGTRELWADVPVPTAILTLIAFGALPLTAAILNYSSQNLRGDRAAYEYAREVLDSVPDGSLVMSASEDKAFSLWYMGFVDDSDRELAPVAVPLLQFEWYWRSLSSRFPDRFPAEPPADVREALERIVEHNDGRSGVFFTYRDGLLERSFEMTQVGSRLYQAVPKED